MGLSSSAQPRPCHRRTSVVACWIVGSTTVLQERPQLLSRVSSTELCAALSSFPERMLWGPFHSQQQTDMLKVAPHGCRP